LTHEELLELVDLLEQNPGEERLILKWVWEGQTAKDICIGTQGLIGLRKEKSADEVQLEEDFDEPVFPDRRNRGISDKPYFDEENDCWAVDTDHGHEEGDLLYVVSEYVRGGLYFPFSYGPDGARDHEHEFELVIQSLLYDPKTFSIEGYEEYYSAQELKLLKAIQDKLLEKSGEDN